MWRKSFVLVLVGMMTMIVIIAISARGVSAQSPVPPNLDGYCKSLGFTGVKQDPTQPNNPYGKGCVDASGKMFGIDMQAACRWQFGDVFPIAQYPDPLKPDWLCYPNTNTAPKVPPPGTPIPPASPTQQQNGNPSQQQSNASDAKFPDAQESDGPGVKVPIICKDWGHGWATGEPTNAWGWKCDDGFSFNADTFANACRDAWGSSRPYATLADWKNKYGWRCSSQPGYVDPYQRESSGNSGSTGNSGTTLNTNCSSAPSRLHAGDVSWVSDADPYPLLVYSEPRRNAPVIANVPIRETVTVLSDPVCADDATWVRVNYGSITGWAAEANHLGNYNLIPGTWGGGSNGGNRGGNGQQPGASGNCRYDALHPSDIGSGPIQQHTHVLDVVNPDPNINYGQYVQDGTMLIYYHDEVGVWETFQLKPWSNTRFGIWTEFILVHPGWLDDGRWYIGPICVS